VYSAVTVSPETPVLVTDEVKVATRVAWPPLALVPVPEPLPSVVAS